LQEIWLLIDETDKVVGDKLADIKELHDFLAGVKK